MGEESANARVIREIVDAWNAGDEAALSAPLDPEAELVPLRAQLEDSSYTGPDGMRQMRADLLDEWERVEVTIDELIETGDTVVIESTLRARGRASGVELEIRGGWLIKLADGRITYVRAFSAPEEAYSAAGLAP